jgi:Fe-S cluster biogenesis protein NfuA
MLPLLSLCGALVLLSQQSLAFAPARPSFVLASRLAQPAVLAAAAESTSSESSSSSPTVTTAPPAPVFDGKRVLPYKVLSAGLKGQSPVAAVYAVLNSSYKRGQDGWETALHVGVTQDLQASLSCHTEQEHEVAHVRALSFADPQPNAMQQVVQQWRELAQEAGAALESSWADDVLSYLYDDDDEIDDDVDDDTIISPFDKSSSEATTLPHASSSDTSPLEFTAENVDAVLNEVRPYLIADGGNVSVERVDVETKNVYLKLEGACGSCASSTVTMQMGIERVLRENFAELNEVLQIDQFQPSALTWEAVEEEVNRLGSAVSAMGGEVKLLDVEVSTGTVKIMYKGPSKVQQGLELAVRDVPFVESVVFVDEVEE